MLKIVDVITQSLVFGLAGTFRIVISELVTEVAAAAYRLRLR